MSAKDKVIHDETVDHLDRLINSANEAKENFLLKRYEESSGNLDDAADARKRADALINEMWE